MKLIIALVLTCVSIGSLAESVNRLADQRSVIFDRIGTEDGLSQGIVTSFAQDARGFIWIGTQEGLNRFDGFQFESYYHIEGDSTSLSHDSIWALHFDSTDRFWIGTDAGLNYYDENTKTFGVFPVVSGVPQPEIYCILEDSSGSIWVGSSIGLSKITKEGVTKLFRDADFGPNFTGGVRALAVAKDGNLFIGSEKHGLFEIGFGSDKINQLLLDLENQEIVDDLHIRDLVVDNDENLWVGTFNGGLSVLDDKSGLVKKFSPESGNRGPLASNRVRSVFEDAGGDIWIGTDSGLHLWLPDTQRFLLYELDLTDPRSISDNSIVDIFQDEGGVIWVGTFNGISKWNAQVEMFPYFKRSASSGGIVPGDNVTSFTGDTAGNVWIGTLSGLMHWDADGGRLTSLSAQEVGLSDQRVMSLARYEEEVWVGTMAGGVNVVDGEGGTRNYTFSRYDSSSLSANAITKIYVDSKENVWVATYGGGVNKYLGDGQFKRYPDPRNENGTFPDGRCLDVLEDGNGRIWIATDGGGVVILDPESGDTHVLSHDRDNANSLASDNNLSLLRTSIGMWVGSVDRGLSYYDALTGQIKRYTKKDGLASDSVYGLLEDDHGNIWISGAKGLSMLDLTTSKFIRFDSSHGLQSSDFNSGAYTKLGDGSLVFGGNNGFNAFYPNRIRLNDHIPSVQITSFKLFNQPLNVSQAISANERIELDFDDSVVGFSFAALDYTAPKKNQYRYKLEGFDRDWVQHQGSREVTYTNLDAGDYVFRVQGSNNDGVWNESGASLSLLVRPAPWLTWWAYCLYVSFAAIGFYMLLRYNSIRLKRDAERRYSERLQLYIESLEEASDGILISDSTGTLMYANNTITEGLNKTPSEVVGESLWDVLFEDEKDVEHAREALQADGRFHGEVQLDGVSGSTVTHEVTIAAVQQSSNSELAYVGISRDVTGRKVTEAELEDYRKNLEQLVEERTEALQKEIAENKAIQVHLADSLHEKELLIKEVHHRVKNNMQVISSLLSIQAEGAKDEIYSNLLNESQQRIKSMALIHETLYQSKDLLKIDFQEYIDTLTTSLSRSYSVPGVSVYVNVNVEDVALDLETAVPCGLVINELVSNALKHAFHGKQGTGVIDINFVSTGCNYELRIADNGCGLPEGFDPAKNVSMGMEIVSILTSQLEGSLKAENDQGAVFEINFPRRAHA